MRFAKLKEFRAALLGKKQGREVDARPKASAPLVDPLSVGLRVDLTVPAGRGREMAATKLICVSPAGSASRSVRSVRILLIPN